MFQRAHAKQRQIEPVRSPANDLQPVLATPGKRTLTAGLGGTLGAPDRYTHAVESAKRELRAVRSTALPAYIKLLRRTDLAPLAKQIELMKASFQVRHLLMTANQHVAALEKSMTHRDPMVLFLRADLATLTTRAAKLGVYRGAEAMKPRAFEEETKQPTARGEGAQLTRTSNKTNHADRAPAKPSATAVASTTKVMQPPVAPVRTRLARGTARYSAPVQRKAVTARTADAGAVAANGAESGVHRPRTPACLPR